MMPQTISEMFTILQQHRDVVGLIEFGSESDGDNLPGADYDLFVVMMRTDPLVRSIHFCVGAIPVDLNLITLVDLLRLDPADSFRWHTLRSGRIRYDPTGAVTQALAHLRQQPASMPVTLSEHAIATTRHWHQHMLDKLSDRVTTMPVFCRFVLHANLARLISNYFRVRNQPFPGETQAIAYLRDHEPVLFAAMSAFYQTLDIERQIELTIAMSEHILAPVGGLWHHDEILAFGSAQSNSLQAQGVQMFEMLFGSPGGQKCNP